MGEGDSISMQRGRRGWHFLMWFILLTALAGHLFADIARSPDFDPYVGIADNLMSLDFADLVPFETLSRGMLMMSALMFGNAYEGVVFVHWINSLAFVCGFIVVTRQNGNNWQGALLAFAVYGVLLCFITLRATPAYLIATYAVLHQRQRPRLSIGLLILAAGFHVSALLVLPAILANQLSWRLSSKWHKRLCFVFYFAGIGSYVAILLGMNFGNALGGFFGGYDDLMKFVTYAEEEQSASIAHKVYFMLVCFLAAIFLLNQSEKVREQKMFVCISLLVLALASISPVVAYRQSLYLTIPILLLFPWGAWINSDVKAIVFWIVCATVSFFNFYSIFY